MERKILLSIGLVIVVTSLCFTLQLPKVYAQSLITPTPTGTPVTTTLTATPTETTSVTPTPTLTSAPAVFQSSATVKTQYPWNKRIPVVITITPNVSGSKLEVRWQKKAGLVSTQTSAVLLNPIAGKTYTFSFELTPYAPGFQRAVADVILTTYTTNYVSSVDVPMQLNASKVVLPITMTYTLYQIGMYLAIFLVFFVVIPFALYKTFMYAKTNVFPKWLESKIKSGQ